MRYLGGVVLLGVLASAVPAMAQQGAKPAPDSSGPQTAVPAPLPTGTADVPGGSARNGVIKPPDSAGTMPIVAPPVRGSMPVIPPPGTPDNAPHVQPK